MPELGKIPFLPPRSQPPSPTGGSAGGEIQRVFISHAGPDRAWAEWVALQLHEAGYVVELDVWDWAAGDNFVVQMQTALATADILVSLFSESYFEAQRYTTDEWTAIVAARSQKRFVPVRVEEVAVPTLLRPLITCDLIGLSEVDARQALLEAVAGKSPSRPAEVKFPGRILADRDKSGGPPGAPPRTQNIRPHSPVFTGRDKLLVKLSENFRAQSPPALQILTGMGGVGKTMLATEYALRFGAHYSLIWQVDAEKVELISEQLASLGVAAGVVDARESPATAAALVKDHLRQRSDWLLIFDNAEASSNLLPWLPAGPGHTLVTSRNPHWAQTGIHVPVQPFTREESVALLRRLRPTILREEAASLGDALGDLPLAIAQAAGLLAESTVTVPKYLDLLRRQASAVLSVGIPSFYSASLAAAVKLSIDKLEEEDLAAAQLIKTCSFLAPELIPDEFFSAAPENILPDPLREMAQSPLAFQGLLAKLSRFGLVQISEGFIGLHELMRLIIRELHDETEAESAKLRVRELVLAARPGKGLDYVEWQGWARVLPYLLSLDPVKSDNSAVRSMTCDAVRYLLATGATAQAVQLSTDAFIAWRRSLGLDHLDSLAAGQVYAEAIRSTGRLAEAREIHSEVVCYYETRLGTTHELTLAAMSSLAADLRALGEVEAADRLGGELHRRLKNRSADGSHSS